jgi:hypothetical protein
MFETRDFSFIHKYFMGEKQESLLFLIVGISAIIIAIVFFFFIKTNPSFFKGAAIPLLALGLLQAIVGYTVYSRSDKQRMDVSYNLGMEPARYVKTEEMPRMEKVMKNFVTYRWLEIAFLIGGIALIFLFKTNPGKSFWYGLGITLTIQSAIMLGADSFAESRGKKYVGELEKIAA